MGKPRRISHDGALEMYVVYRFKLDEYILLVKLWRWLRKSPTVDKVLGEIVDRDPPAGNRKDLASVVGVANQIWLDAFFDPRGINVFEFWPVLFPHRAEQIEAFRVAAAPELKILERFRNITAAHAARTIEEHNKARAALGGPQLLKLNDGFMDLATYLAKDESKVKGMPQILSLWNMRPGHVEQDAAAAGLATLSRRGERRRALRNQLKARRG